MAKVTSNNQGEKKLLCADPRYVTRLEDLNGLSDQEKFKLTQVTDKYDFRANDYYLSLIDWNDPNDPIRNLIVPREHELEDWGHLDPSGEQEYTVMPGVEHKYDSTVLLLVSKACGGICRYCFRKRVFIYKDEEILQDLPAALQYVREHPEITNVLLTGGDPLLLNTNELREIIDGLMQIEHVRIIRIGSKMPAFNPCRILQDPDLLKLFEETCTDTKQLYVVVHFDHEREITEAAIRAIKAMRKTGAELANQTPLIRGINDDPDVLAALFQKLSFVGVPPYYVFQCRPALGNRNYVVPIEQGYQIFEQAKVQVSGLAKRARYTMSHASGKIEVVGLTDNHVYFKYHRAANYVDSGRLLIFERNQDAYWLDDYETPVFTGTSTDCDQ